MIMVLPLPAAISLACPMRPKPVISVQLFTEKPSRAKAASLLREAIDSISAFSVSGVSRSAFMAVLRIPVPIALVSISRSPSLIVLFRRIFSG